MDNDEYNQMIGSSKTYSKIGRWVEAEYDIPFSNFSSGRKVDNLMRQIRAAVRACCREAAEEGAEFAFRLAAENLPFARGEGLYVPKSEIVICSGGVGRIVLSGFNSNRAA